MDSPETYNRVNIIEKNILRTLLAVFATLLISASIGSVVHFSITIGLPPLKDLIIYAVGTLVGLAIWFYAKTITSYCHFCGGELSHINRDMILSSDYLAMQGTKKGNYYYAPCKWAEKYSPTGWAKISHQATACHHCRISKEGYQAHYDVVSHEELAKTQSKR
ncbi:MAG: hypothetical protein ACJA0N_001665 [Pseudohongiellaceae bacterium]|jgi:hypothetical protein